MTTRAFSGAIRGGLSACVIARDSEETLERCIESVRWADECLVVLDDRTRDASEEVAISAGARVVRHRYEGNVEQKNFALTQLGSDWVLQLDADEALSDELEASVREWLAGPASSFEGAELNRVTLHLGRWLRHGDFHPDWQLRLFRRRTAQWSGQNPHGRVCLEGPVDRIEGDLEHRSYRDLADQVERVREFSKLEANAMWLRGRRTKVTDLALRPAARFFRAYLLRAGFRDGVPGFLVAAITALHVLLKYASLRELELRLSGSSSNRRK